MIADEFRYGLWDNDALAALPDHILSLPRSLDGIALILFLITVVALCLSFGRKHVVFHSVFKGSLVLCLPVAFTVFVCAMIMIQGTARSHLLAELIEVQNDMRRIGRFSEQLEFGFSAKIKQLVEEGKRELSGGQSDAQLEDWFKIWTKKAGIWAIVTNGANTMNLTTQSLHDNSRMMLPSLHQIVRLKVKEAEEDTTDSIYATLSLAKSMLRNSFRGMQFMDLFINNPNRLYDATQLGLFDDLNSLKTFWTYLDLPNNEDFWLIIGLLAPESVDTSIRLQIKQFESAMNQRSNRALGKVLIDDFSELPAHGIVLGSKGYHIFAQQKLVGLQGPDHIMVLLDGNPIVSRQTEQENLFFLICCLILLMPLVIAACISFGLSRPLQQMRTAIRALLDDQPAALLTRSGRDQLAELTDLFNQFLKSRQSLLASEQFYSKTSRDLCADSPHPLWVKLLGLQGQTLELSEVRGQVSDLLAVPDWSESCLIVYADWDRILVYGDFDKFIPSQFTVKRIKARLYFASENFLPHVVEEK